MGEAHGADPAVNNELEMELAGRLSNPRFQRELLGLFDRKRA
jgi:hypothetical protein